MNIQDNYSYNYNVSMQGKGRFPKKPGDKPLKRIREKIEQKILNLLPEKTFVEDESKLDKFDKYGSTIARPDVNRLIMGVTAIATQPAIDYYNHRVDKETRVVSRNRTIAKIIACTSVGVLVRGSCYRAVNKMTDINGTKKFSKLLLPEKYIEPLTKFAQKLANHKNTVSTILALMVMTFTNFLLDAPLTVHFTNRLNDRSVRNGELKEVNNG